MKKPWKSGSIPSWKFKVELKMKLSLLILMTITCTMHSNSGFSQKTRISLSMYDVTVANVIDEIESNTEFKFIFNTKAVDLKRKVSIDVDRQKIGQVLKLLFNEVDVSYEVYDFKVLLKKPLSKTLDETKTPTRNQSPQEFTVSGTVSDADGTPLPGASILEKGTTNGVQSDFDGNFSIEISDENAILVVSYIGFATQEIAVNGQTTFTVSLKESAAGLEEVVVIGYGSIKKSDLTGSVTSLKSDDINQGVNSSLDQMLQGRAAGVNVVQNSSEPGGGISISVRGSSSFTAGSQPLYVIDGLPIENASLTSGAGASFPGARTSSNPLSSINPNDIESIEILKDASATAIYGSRGANGVVLVTTKKGTTGKFNIEYDTYFGIQNVIGKLDVLSPQEYMQVLNDIIADGGGIADQEVSEIQNGGTDWQDLIFRKNSPVQSHNISLSGGGDKTNYYAALNFFDQQGVVISSGFKRYGARINVNSKVSDKLEVGINLNTSFSDNDQVAAQSFGVNLDNGALYSAYNYDPTLTPYDGNGDYQRSPFHSLDHPLALANGKTSFTKSYRTTGVAFVNYHLFPSLSFKLNVGTDVINQRKDVYINRETIDGAANGGIGTIFQDNNSNYLVEATATFDKTYGIHKITALAGYTTQKFFNKSTYSEARGFPADATASDNLGLGDPTRYILGSGRSENQLISYMNRLNYILSDKYLFTTTLRIDGSSRFGDNNKYGYFPSAAFGWKLKEENFLKNSELISSMKLRASWGQTGNQSIGNYQSLNTLASGPTVVFNVGGASTQISTTNPSRIANPDLKWETTEQWDIGLDFGFFGERISGTMDYYEKKTFDMLINLPIPTSTGFGSQLTNIGSITNTGFEFNLTTRNIQGQNFHWTSNINMATIKNRVNDLGPVEQIIEGGAGFSGGFFFTETGQALRSFYGYQIDGIWQNDDNFSTTTDNVAPGDIKYRDTDGDGTVNANDRVILGNSFPDFTWSFNNTFDYQDLSLSIFFEGVEGINMLNQNLVDTYFPINFRRNKFAEPYLNRWTPENSSNIYPSFVNPGGQGTKQANSYTVEDASYVRLKTVTLSYKLPKFTEAIEDASIYVTGTNLFTITDYKGIDPAVNPNGNALSRIDYNAYPSSKSFLLGLNVKF